MMWTMVRSAHLGLACAVIGACSPAPPTPLQPPPPTVAIPPATMAATAPVPPALPRGVVFRDLDRVDLETDLAFSPDGSSIALEQAPYAIVLFESKTGDRRAAVSTPGDVLDVGFRADGRAFWAVCTLGAAAWEVSGAPIFAVETRSVRTRRTAAWSPSGERLAVLDDRGALRIVDGRTAAVVWQADAGVGARIEMWSVGSDIVVTAREGAHTLWNGDDGARLGELRPAKPWSFDSLAPDARTALLVKDELNQFRFVDPRTGAVRAEHRLAGKAAYQSPHVMRAVKPYEGDPAQIANVAWRPDGSMVAIAHDPPNTVHGMNARFYAVTLYDARTGKKRRSPRDWITPPHVWWSRDGSRLYGEDQLSQKDFAWDASTGATVKGPIGIDPSRPVGIGVYQNENKLVVSAWPGGNVLWSAPLELLGRKVNVHVFAPGAVGQPFVFDGPPSR